MTLDEKKVHSSKQYDARNSRDRSQTQEQLVGGNMLWIVHGLMATGGINAHVHHLPEIEVFLIL